MHTEKDSDAVSARSAPTCTAHSTRHKNSFFFFIYAATMHALAQGVAGPFSIFFLFVFVLARDRETRD